MAGLVEDAMKQKIKKVQPMTAGAYAPDPVNNTAVMAPQPMVGDAQVPQPMSPEFLGGTARGGSAGAPQPWQGGTGLAESYIGPAAPSGTAPAWDQMRSAVDSENVLNDMMVAKTGAMGQAAPAMGDTGNKIVSQNEVAGTTAFSAAAARGEPDQGLPDPPAGSPTTPAAPPPDDGGQGLGGGNTEPGGGGTPGTGTNPLNRPPGTPPPGTPPAGAPNGSGANPLNRPPGSSPDSNGSGVQTPPANPGNPAAPVGNDPTGTGYYPGGVVPPGGNPGGSAPPPAAPTGTPSWDPSTGLTESITQGGTVDATSRGYTAREGGEARGYTAEGYDPSMSGENLSSAIDRIIDKGGPLMQRADAAGRAASNRRGVLNSTMGVQASQNAVLDKASEIGAGDVQNAQFNARQKDEAAQFGANARNRAAEFGAGEANDMMMFAAEQYNIAERFAAEAANAANSQNAAAQTAAMQKYNDALNAARAAEKDAENLARRDTAQFQQQTREGNADRSNRIATASIGANASVQAANINAASRAAESAADRADRALDRQMRREEFDTNTQIRIDQMGEDAFGRYTTGRNAIITGDMEPDQRRAALRAWDQSWSGRPYVGLDIPYPGDDDEGDAPDPDEED